MSNERDYQPQDAISKASSGAMVTGAVGAFVAATQNALARENRGALGIFTHSGRTILVFTVVGGVFEFTKAASANLRQKNDHYNSAIGGFLAGSIIGVQSARMPAVLGYGLLSSSVLGVADYTGGLAGFRRDKEVDEFERKETLRLNRRRPIEETIADIGEGRGIKSPGYEERRRQRLKEKYGLDINPVSAV